MNFDLENTRRVLIARRIAVGADTPAGHACSTLAEQLPNLATYERPAWAKDERQTLAWKMNEQIERLAPSNIQ
ncbi:MAG: hypothetical protein JWR80_10007 [Bradyrhizobium sp.]|nr:hypothetical protein [Bradyrhizobium sp.]